MVWFLVVCVSGVSPGIWVTCVSQHTHHNALICHNSVITVNESCHTHVCHNSVITVNESCHTHLGVTTHSSQLTHMCVTTRVLGLGQITWWIVMTKKMRGHSGKNIARKSRNSCRVNSRSCGCIGTVDWGPKCAYFWNQIQTLKWYFFCHIYCALLWTL